MIAKQLRVVKLLLWKCWKIRSHHRCCFALFFVLPLLYPILFALLYGSEHERLPHNTTGIDPAVYTHPFDLIDRSLKFLNSSSGYRSNVTDYKVAILYTPETNYTKQVMEKVKSILETKSNFTFNVVIRKANDRNEIKSKLNAENGRWDKGDTIVAGGVRFINTDTGPDGIPTSINYELISTTSFGTSRKYNFPGRVSFYEKWPLDYEYTTTMFSAIQAAVDVSHYQVLSNKSADIDMFIQLFPVPERESKFGSLVFDVMSSVFTSMFMMSLLVIIPVIVKRIVEEKATRVKEYLTCCGVTPPTYWCTTVFDAFSLIAVEVSLVVLIFATRGVRHYVTSPTEPSYEVIVSILGTLNVSYPFFFLVMFLYCLQSSLFACLITIFFTSPNVAAAVAIVVWPLSFCYSMFLHFVRTFNYVDPWGLEFFSCLFPNCALYWLFHIFRGRHYPYEKTGFSNMFTNSWWLDKLHPFHVLSMMVFAIICYSFLLWYLSCVWPWQEGVHKPWHFPIAKLYNQYVLKKGYCDLTNNSSSTPLTVTNVSKLFSLSSKPVLRNVNFELESNSLTVLLGPNGSGKSTLINIITGLIESTKGSVFVNGYDIETRANEAQSFLGICPQHNTYFKFLTIKEQLTMIYTLKCILRDKNEGITVDEVIQFLDLGAEANQLAVNLSGGILRRMTLAMAMVGPSAVLIIDEPTESLDPLAKRKVWDVLVETRKTKTILVCSHQLDEVNVIADKVAILVYGELKCVDTTLNLKKTFGTGYRIKIVKNLALMTEDKIKSTFHRHIPNSKCETSSSDCQELVFTVAFEDSKCLSELFRELENESVNLGILSMSLHATSLEDAYLKLVDSEVTVDDTIWNFEHTSVAEESNFDVTDVNVKRESCFNYFVFLQLKNFNYTIRNYTVFIILIVIPVILLFLTLAMYEVINTQVHGEYNPILNQNIYEKGTYAFVLSSSEKFSSSYEKLVANAGNNVYFASQNLPIQDWILQEAQKDLSNYYYKFLYGVTYIDSNPGNLTVWFNPSGHHTLPISVNLATNALLNSVANDKQFVIQLENHHLMDQFELRSIYSPEQFSAFNFTLIAIFIFLYSISNATYVLRPITEKTIGFKHLQLMTGIQPIFYWLSNFTFDLVLNVFCSFFYIAVYYIFDGDNLYIGSGAFFVPMIVTFFFGGFANIPFAYALSFIFKKPTSGYIFFAITTTLVGQSLFLISEFEQASNETYSIQILLLIAFPFITFSKALASLHRAFVYNTYCNRIDRLANLTSECSSSTASKWTRICCENLCDEVQEEHRYHYASKIRWECHRYRSPFTFDGNYNVAQLIAFLAISGLLYFTLTNLLEYSVVKAKICRFFSWIWNFVSRNVFQEIVLSCGDGEVQQEANDVRDIVKNNRVVHESLVVYKLTKAFKHQKLPENLNFAVHKGECFGLLGSNGSGKTVTFRLLTGELRPTLGNAFITDVNTSLTRNTRSFLSRIGYCPQNDALLDCLTGIETLKLFMKLRGKDDIHHLQRVVNKFHLQSVINQRVSTYSGGNRRKLSLALSLIGNQKLLLLDEPTNGVDPASRHHVWDLLQNILESFDVSILLSSHNMEEVEALCNRIAIMAKGKLRCIGSLSELKSRFGKGYCVIIKVKKDSNASEAKSERVKQLMANCFGAESVTLKYENLCVLYYNLSTDSIFLSEIFEKMEHIRGECDLEDYFVSNATLEQTLFTFMDDK